MATPTTTTYTTQQGDMLDLVVFNFYGSTLNGQIEAVLSANQSLDLGQYVILPPALTITLPVIAPVTKPIVQLFS